MAYVMSSVIRLVDEASPVLNNIGNTGSRVIAGLEDDFIKVDSAMNQTAKTATGTATSLSKLSSDSSSVATQSRLIANAMNDEAEKMRKAAQSAQLKADISERMAEAARSHYNELKKEVEASEDVTDAMKESASAALKEAERLEKAAEAARKKADAAEKSADAAQENAYAAEQAAKADEQLYNAANKTASAEQKVAESLNKSEQEAREYGEAAGNAADESEKLGSSGANAGELLQDAFTAIGVAAALRKIADGFIECTNASIEFESAITGVYKTVDGTDEQLAQISDDIKAMSLEIPSTTTEIAGVAESAGQLGIATDNITSFTETMINLGEATNLSSDEAASSLAKFANITGMSAENYENLGSSVVALGNNFATTEADIVAMATRMASAGTLAGLTETDILGLAAAMSSVGIEADAGGSAMSTLLSDIQVAVETGSDDLEDFASVANMTSEQFQSAFRDNAANALYAFIDGLNDVERNGETATVILENMGITEIRLSNAVKSLASNSGGLAEALDVSSQAWEENTALAAEANTRYSTLESRLAITKNAANNLKIAFGDVLTPAIGEFADMGTNALSWLTDFIEKNPVVVEGITGITIALGTAVGAVTVATTAVKALNVVTKTFNLTLSGSQIGMIVGGIAAAGVAIGGLIHYFNSAEDAVEDYNGTLEQCRTEIDNTRTAYENVCKMYGEESQAAQNLASELDTLNAQYQKGGGFAEDYAQRLEESKQALDSFTTEYNSKMDEINKDWQNGMVAAAQLDALSEKTQLTNADLDMMSKYADYLNDTFNCNIEVNYDTGELTGFDPTDVNGQLLEQAKKNRALAAAESLVDGNFTYDYTNQLKELANAKDELYVLYMKLDKFNNPNFANPENWDFNKLYDDYQRLSDEVEKGNAELDGYNNTIRQLFIDMGNPEGAEEYIQQLNTMAFSFDEIKDSAEEAQKAMTPQEAAKYALSDVSDQILELAEAYDEAYNSAYESFQGQFGLFDEAQADADATVTNAQAALDSQLAYWESYQANIEYIRNVTAEDLGVTQAEYDAFMSYVRSGTPEAVGLLDDMVSNIENGNSGAVTNVIETQSKIDQIQSETADATANWITDYEKKMQDFVDGASKKIEELDQLKGTAKISAINTVQAYANAISSQKGNAVSAAQSLVNEVQAVFNNASYNLPDVSSGSTPSVTTTPSSSGTTTATTVTTNATGTTYADDIYIAGEEGPELIIGKKGSTVFPADETNRIIEAVSEPRQLYIPPSESPVKQIDNSTNNTSRREISLDINGKGSINVRGGVDKEQVVTIIMENLKPVLMNIVAQEIFEEGDNSYEI